ncbi:hypothetical protein BJ741DRAFT_250656 [Chytriomyces cf. hyalinus JEL632]|nr:hypothetical protein BJ741DRAFT_250656 [Chytriomyces cf. hyalinus JEL632]
MQSATRPSDGAAMDRKWEPTEVRAAVAAGAGVYVWSKQLIEQWGLFRQKQAQLHPFGLHLDLQLISQKVLSTPLAPAAGGDTPSKDLVQKRKRGRPPNPNPASKKAAKTSGGSAMPVDASVGSLPKKTVKSSAIAAAASAISTNTITSTTEKKESNSNSDSDTTANAANEGGVKVVRKDTHNVIEKRYRTNLNQRILDLKLSIPCLNGPESEATTGKKEKVAVADGDDDAGAGAGGRLNKGTILQKATEYIKELEMRLLANQTQFEKLKSNVVERFGADGQALVSACSVNMIASLASPVASLSQTNVTKPAVVKPLQKQPSKPPAQLAPSGFALIHQQQQQIQQWLAIQQQYQVAAAVAAAASVEAFNSLANPTPPPASPPIPTTANGIQSPSNGSMSDNLVSFPAGSASPEYGFGLSPPMDDAFGLGSFDLLNSGVADAHGNMGNGMYPDFLASRPEMLLSASIFPDAAAVLGDDDCMFDYLVGFGDDMQTQEQKQLASNNQNESESSGMKLLAMMFMSASVLYSPDPFDVGGDESIHQHVSGRMLGRPSSSNLTLKLRGMELSGFLGVGIAGAWLLIKAAVILYGAMQVAKLASRLFGRNGRKQTPSKMDSESAQALHHLKHLTSQTVIPTTVSSNPSYSGLAIEWLRFACCFGVGVGPLIDSILSMRKRQKTQQWHALVAKAASRALDSFVAAPTRSSIQLTTISLVALSHASMAASFFTPIEASKLKMTCAMALRCAVYETASENLSLYSRFVVYLANWLWAEGLSDCQDLIREYERHDMTRHVPRWILDTVKEESGFWSTESATDIFESDRWIPTNVKGIQSPLSALHRFAQSSQSTHMMHDVSNFSKSLVATSAHPCNPTQSRNEKNASHMRAAQTFIHHLHDAQLYGDKVLSFCAASLAMVACWNARVSVPTFVSDAWMVGLDDGVDDRRNVSRKVSAIALLACTLIMKGEGEEFADDAQNALNALEQIISARNFADGVPCGVSACVEFSALSWVLGALEACREGQDNNATAKATQVLIVARMRTILPNIVLKESNKENTANGLIDCMLRWMSAVKAV